MIAGRRFGKTRFGSLALAEEASIPNTIHWACAPTNDKLHRYVIPAMEKLIPRSWVKDWSSEHKDLLLKNGSLIHFQTLEDPDQGRGQGLDSLWIDEICELTLKHWEVIAPSLGEKQGAAFFTTSPRSYDWVYEKFFEPATKKEPGFWGLHAKTADNPIFQTPEGKAWLDMRRRTMSPEMFRQEHEADFVTFTGAVYGSLLLPQILHTDEQIREHLPLWPEIEQWREVYMGIDTGADHPFGCVKAVIGEKGLIVVDDYLMREKSFLEHAQAMKSMAAAPNVRWAINKNEKQPMIELGQHGIHCLQAANDHVAGIERVKSLLFQRHLWFIDSKVPRTVQQMKSYRYDQNYSEKTGEKLREQVFKKNDELPDCIRYIAMVYPRLRQSAPPESRAKRDISKLPEDVQRAIERMRRIDNPPKEFNESTTAPDLWS
jgi:phage terminase large subunit